MALEPGPFSTNKMEKNVMKKQLGPSNAIFPIPAALIVSGEKDNANIITIAWIGIASSTPPTIGISIRKTRHSLKLIRNSREFSVNIPPSSFVKEVDYCGMTTGLKRREIDLDIFVKLMN